MCEDNIEYDNDLKMKITSNMREDNLKYTYNLTYLIIYLFNYLFI